MSISTNHSAKSNWLDAVIYGRQRTPSQSREHIPEKTRTRTRTRSRSRTSERSPHVTFHDDPPPHRPSGQSDITGNVRHVPLKKKEIPLSPSRLPKTSKKSTKNHVPSSTDNSPSRLTPPSPTRTKKSSTTDRSLLEDDHEISDSSQSIGDLSIEDTHLNTAKRKQSTKQRHQTSDYYSPDSSSSSPPKVRKSSTTDAHSEHTIVSSLSSDDENKPLTSRSTMQHANQSLPPSRRKTAKKRSSTKKRPPSSKDLYPPRFPSRSSTKKSSPIDHALSGCSDETSKGMQDSIAQLQDANKSLASQVEWRNKQISGLEGERRTVELILQSKLAHISELEDNLAKMRESEEDERRTVESVLKSKLGHISELEENMAKMREHEGHKPETTTNPRPVQDRGKEMNVAKLKYSEEDDRRTILQSKESILQSKLAHISELEENLAKMKGSKGNRLVATTNVQSVQDRKITCKDDAEILTSKDPLVRSKAKQSRKRKNQSVKDKITIINESEASYTTSNQATDESVDTESSCTMKSDESLDISDIFAGEFTPSHDNAELNANLLKSRIIKVVSDARMSNEKMSSLQYTIDSEQVLHASLRSEIEKITTEKAALKSHSKKEVEAKEAEIMRLKDIINEKVEAISTITKAHLFEIEELGKSHRSSMHYFENTMMKEREADMQERTNKMEELHKQISSLTEETIYMEKDYSSQVELLELERSADIEKMEILQNQIICIEQEKCDITASFTQKCNELESSLEENKAALNAEISRIIQYELEIEGYKKDSIEDKNNTKKLAKDLEISNAKIKTLEEEAHSLKDNIEKLKTEKDDISKKCELEKENCKKDAESSIKAVEAEKSELISKHEEEKKNYENEACDNEDQIEQLIENLEEKEKLLNAKSFLCF